jgi:hypothetical protein
MTFPDASRERAKQDIEAINQFTRTPTDDLLMQRLQNKLQRSFVISNPSMRNSRSDFSERHMSGVQLSDDYALTPTCSNAHTPSCSPMIAMDFVEDDTVAQVNTTLLQNVIDEVDQLIVGAQLVGASIPTEIRQKLLDLLKLCTGARYAGITSSEWRVGELTFLRPTIDRLFNVKGFCTKLFDGERAGATVDPTEQGWLGMSGKEVICGITYVDRCCPCTDGACVCDRRHVVALNYELSLPGGSRCSEQNALGMLRAQHVPVRCIREVIVLGSWRNPLEPCGVCQTNLKEVDCQIKQKFPQLGLLLYMFQSPADPKPKCLEDVRLISVKFSDLSPIHFL